MRRLLYLIPLAFLTASVAISALALRAALRVRGQPFAGFFVQENGAVSPIRRAAWPGSSEGVSPGIRVVSIDDHRVHGGRELAKMLAEHHVGDVVFVAFETGPARPFVLRRLTDRDFAATFVFPFCVGVLFLLVGTVIFFAKRTYAAGLLLSICIVASVFHMAMFDAQTTYGLARIWVAYPLLGAVALHLFAVFPAERPRIHRPLPLGASYATAFVLVALREVFHRDPRASEWVALAMAFYLAGAFVGCAALLLRTRRVAALQTVRNKARVILWGLMVTVAASVAWIFVVRVWPDALTVERVMMASSFFPVLIAYATLKHDLFDVDAVLRATFTYVIVTALVVCLYAAVVAATGLAAARLGVVGTVAGAVALTLAVSLAFHPLRVRVQEVVDRMLFPERQNVQDVLHGLAGELASVETLDGLADQLLPRVGRAVGAKGVALFVADRKQGAFLCVAHWGEIDPAIREALATREAPTIPAAELSLPLRAGGETVGIVAFAAKHKAELYTAAEVETLREIVPAAATAARVALLLSERTSRERLATLGEVAAILIHDFKNPLGILKVSLGTLKKRLQVNRMSLELADCMEEEVDRMNRTSLQLLHFARPQPAEMSSCDVAHVLRRTIERMRPHMEARKVVVRLELDETGVAQADSVAMERVFINLLDNALVAMPSGGELTISLCHLRRLVEIVVADTGIGMDDATRARIFQPFFTTRPGGTGLGLAIVRQILDEHRASIDVESTLGGGTRFTICLPAA